MQNQLDLILFSINQQNIQYINATTYTYIYDNSRLRFSITYIEYQKVSLQSHNNTQQSKEFKLQLSSTQKMTKVQIESVWCATTQSYPGYSAPSQNKQMELQRVIEYPPVNAVGGGNSSNVVAASVGSQNGKGRDELGNMQRTMDQRVNTEVVPNRTRKIFAVSPPPKSQQNIDIGNKLSPRDHSPIKAKPSTITNFANMDQKGPNTATLTNKIALSQNKINQMQKKINRLKQQFNRHNAFQRKNVHISNANTLDYRTMNEKQMINDRYRGSVTPPHHNGHQSPLHQDARPGTRYQKNIRFKSETVVGETAAKWDRKLSQLMGQNGKFKGEEDASFDRKNNNSKTQRNSEIVEDLRQLKRSMITEPTSKRNQLTIITPTYPPQPHQSVSEPREKSPTFTSRTPTSTQQKPPSIPIMFRPVHNHKPVQAVFANGNQAYHQGAPKTNGVQININGNHYMGNGMNSGVNNPVNSGIPINGGVREGYGAVLENKSTIMVRKNHF